MKTRNSISQLLIVIALLLLGTAIALPQDTALDPKKIDHAKLSKLPGAKIRDPFWPVDYTPAAADIKKPLDPHKPPPPKPKRRPNIKVAMPDKNKKQEQPKPDQLTSILRNVEKLRDQPNRRREPMAKAQIQGATTLSASALEQNEMVRAIQEQLRNCWRIDPGARGAEDIVIEIKVLLNQDGSVHTVEIVDVVRMVQDGFFRSAAENAKRAINRCSPFRLPPRKYNVWRQLTLRFDPREMFGT